MIKTSVPDPKSFVLITFANYLYDTNRQTRYPLIESGFAGFYLYKRRSYLLDGVPDG